jgi:hypothetical protein
MPFGQDAISTLENVTGKCVHAITLTQCYGYVPGIQFHYSDNTNSTIFGDDHKDIPGQDCFNSYVSFGTSNCLLSIKGTKNKEFGISSMQFSYLDYDLLNQPGLQVPPENRFEIVESKMCPSESVLTQKCISLKSG